MPYYFKNYPIDFYVDVENGTSVSCYVNPHISTSNVVADRRFKGTKTYSAKSSNTMSFYARCSNRLTVSARSPSINIELREIPEIMTNFSLELPTKIVRVGKSFYLLIVFMKGNNMTCNVSSTTAGISYTYAYTQLTARQISHASGGKAYKVWMSTSVFSLNHQIDVICRNVRNEVKGNISFQAQELVAGLVLTLPTLLCYNETLVVTGTTSRGRPIFASLYINGTKHLEHNSPNGSSIVLHVPSSMYGEPGWKEIMVRARNNLSSTERFAQVRVTRNVTALSVVANFTISSHQALDRRPANLLPINERIDFTALVIPSIEGFVYNWSINGSWSNASNSTPYWNYTFNSAGTYLLTLVVSGCNSLVYQKYFTILEPVRDFEVKIDPYPVVLASGLFSVNVTIPPNSDCMLGYFGQTDTNFTRCRNDSFRGVFCNFSSALCYTTMSFNRSGNFSLNFTASNGLYARVKTYFLVAKSCSKPMVIVQGM